MHKTTGDRNKNSKCHTCQGLYNFDSMLYECPESLKCNKYYNERRSFVGSMRQRD